jgi:hypothetical protein
MSKQPRLDADAIRAASCKIKTKGFTLAAFLTPIAPCDVKALDTFRQWFDAVQDLNPAYLSPADYQLARVVYEQLGMRVPHSVTEGCEK